MKDFSLLIWITQLGFSVAFPLVGFILLGLWLRNSCGWGDWVLWVGISLGVISAIDGFRSSLKALSRLTKKEKKDGSNPVSFNDHS